MVPPGGNFKSVTHQRIYEKVPYAPLFLNSYIEIFSPSHKKNKNNNGHTKKSVLYVSHVCIIKKKGNLGNFLYKCVIQQWIQRFPFGSPCFFVKGNFLLKSLSTNGFSGSPLVPLWFPFLQKITQKHDFRAFFAVLSIILILSLSSQNKSFSLCIILILSMFNDAS